MSNFIPSDKISDIYINILTIFKKIDEKKPKYANHVSNAYLAIYELRELSLKKSLTIDMKKLSLLIDEIKLSLESIVNAKQKACKKIHKLHILINNDLYFIYKTASEELKKITISKFEKEINQLYPVINYPDCSLKDKSTLKEVDTNKQSKYCDLDSMLLYKKQQISLLKKESFKIKTDINQSNDLLIDIISTLEKR
ncbi:hypothetical protein PsalN5692_02888 [Piscirickettsia salmonis]|uniref:hypothetical protein n=1 Tax=Piscirickettsia salmonis TaxID=1238 RepID=UPI0012B9C11D|nr:hypothetical protein [Piscirickettsia salmonis]QGP51405.1 hypothetical protein PsalN5692_02888 [Piscirickettsia salmonis]